MCPLAKLHVFRLGRSCTMKRSIHSQTHLTAFALSRPKIILDLGQRIPRYEEQHLQMLPRTFPSGAWVLRSGKSMNTLHWKSALSDRGSISPGRWHAALVIKMALVHLIAGYEFRLRAERTSYQWFWETFQMPSESSTIWIRKRQQKKDMTA